MEVVQVLHMNKGVGETSYAKNSTLQSKLISIAKHITEEAIQEILSNNVPESMGVADLGCSSGPNALLAISGIIDNIYAKCRNMDRPMPEELRVYLNDLPSNDFNNIFGSLPEFYNKMKTDKGMSDQFAPCFISGVPGSFYGRLFPSKSLHFVHSSSSLHWLSQLPPGLDSKTSSPLNKGKIYISKTSPPSVLAAYAFQFQNDFSLFLRSRSEEVVPGGRMVLSLIGRTSADLSTEDSYDQSEFIAQALMSLVSEGFIEEEKVDSFNVPYYAPSTEELKTEIEKEGSFIIDRLEAFQIDWDEGCDYKTCDADLDNGDVVNGGACTELIKLSCGQRVAKTIRAAGESLLECQFGSHILDALFQRFGKIVDDHLSKTGSYKFTHLVLSLVRKG